MAPSLTQADAETFAREWIEAWNSHDLQRILTHYADDFAFSSPFIIQVVGEQSGTLRGKAAVSAYWAKALARTSDLRFALHSVLLGVRSLVIYYSRHDGRMAAEWFEFGPPGVVIRSAAQYATQ